MHQIAPEVVSIAEASLGGLQGRSALVIGPEELCHPYVNLLRRARMKYIYQEETPARASYLLPYVQLLISLLGPSTAAVGEWHAPLLAAATIAKGCDGRHTPLLIFDLAPFPSVEELAGLLPEVCLYTPDDLRRMLAERGSRAS